MYLCVCLCVSFCVHTCAVSMGTYVNVYAQIYICACVNVCAHGYVCAHMMCVCTWLNVHVWVWVLMCTHNCVRAVVCTHGYVCMCVHLCIHSILHKKPYLRSLECSVTQLFPHCSHTLHNSCPRHCNDSCHMLQCLRVKAWTLDTIYGNLFHPGSLCLLCHFFKTLSHVSKNVQLARMIWSWCQHHDHNRNVALNSNFNL